ncbi:MAG: hypothetical protein K9L85_00040 [Candidatus Peribacteraceae bacterium]|nr:hypothetical protein [Candidatus Peribacteraceae bacterium]
MSEPKISVYPPNGTECVISFKPDRKETFGIKVRKFVRAAMRFMVNNLQGVSPERCAEISSHDDAEQ